MQRLTESTCLYRRTVPANEAFAYKLAHRALPDLQRMKLCYSGAVVGTEVGLSLGAIKPEYKLDPGFLEHLRLSPRAFVGPGAWPLADSRIR